MLTRLSFTLMTTVAFATASAVYAAPPDDAKVTASDAIMGKWVRHRNTPIGKLTTIKEHFSKRTVVTTYDTKQHLIESHESEYVVDDTGETSIFRYKNKVVLIGPNPGAKDTTERSYIFRVVDNKFYEVHGMHRKDRSRPSVIVWERLKSDMRPKREP